MSTYPIRCTRETAIETLRLGGAVECNPDSTLWIPITSVSLDSDEGFIRGVLRHLHSDWLYQITKNPDKKGYTTIEALSEIERTNCTMSGEFEGCYLDLCRRPTGAFTCYLGKTPLNYIPSQGVIWKKKLEVKPEPLEVDLRISQGSTTVSEDLKFRQAIQGLRKTWRGPIQVTVKLTAVDE